MNALVDVGDYHAAGRFPLTEKFALLINNRRKNEVPSDPLQIQKDKRSEFARSAQSVEVD